MTILTQTYSCLHLRGIELLVHLGWFDQERANLQKILIDIKVVFPEPPDGCKTDNLKDTYCYDTLIQTLIAATSDKEFNLIEHLAAYIDGVIRNTFPNQTRLQISVHKDPRHYIPNLTQGVIFTYGDNL